MPTASPTVRYRLKVSLRHISPMIWRRLVVPSDFTLYGVHRAIQIAFGWEDYHLHAFKAHGHHYGTEWTGQRHYVEDGDDLREVTLSDLSLRLRQKFLYEYDFGDFWEHEARVEAREAADPRRPYPVCVGGARAGPPEDVGGPDGYARLLERLDDLRLRLLFDCPPSAPMRQIGAFPERRMSGSSQPQGAKMRQTSGPKTKPSAEAALKDIRRATRRQFSAEEKIRIVLEGLRGGRTASPSCAAARGSPRRCTTRGPRTSWRPARSAWPATWPAPRPPTRCGTCAGSRAL